MVRNRMVHDLDDVDRGILHALQGNARDATATELSDRVGTSASTVRNRIAALEDTVIRGYHPELDYEAAGLELHLLVVCNAPTAKRSAVAADVLALRGVIAVRELATGSHNIQIEVVADDIDDADEIRARIEAVEDVEIVATQIVTDLHCQPFNHLGTEPADDGAVGD